MKITILNRDVQRRFGTNVMEIPEDTANDWIRKKWAKPFHNRQAKQMADMGMNNLDLSPLKAKRETTGEHCLVAWVQDQPKRQYAIGAEFSNLTVIKIGKKLGFNCKVVTQERFDRKTLNEADFVVLNNISAFSNEQMDDLLMILFERERPYVRYEHDFGFCKHRVGIRCKHLGHLFDKELMGEPDCWEACRSVKQENGIKRLEFYRHILARSFLNIFISPLQMEAHRNALGDVIDPYHFLTPPIDHEHFKIDPNAKRETNLVVSMTGKIDFWNKGLFNVAIYAGQHPEYNFEIYTRSNPQTDIAFRGIENVRVKEHVYYDDLPGIYNRASYIIHLPTGVEAAGRTPVEGFLCGCDPIISNRVGIDGFDFDWSKYEETRERIIQGPYHFWQAIEEEYNRRYC